MTFVSVFGNRDSNYKYNCTDTYVKLLSVIYTVRSYSSI